MSPFTNALLKFWLNCMHSLDGENLMTSKEIDPTCCSKCFNYFYIILLLTKDHDFNTRLQKIFTVYPIPPVKM